MFINPMFHIILNYTNIEEEFEKYIDKLSGYVYYCNVLYHY